MDSEQTLVVAFGSTSLLDDHGPLDELRSTFPNSHLVGCSTSGEIIGTTIQDDSLVVAVARFEHTRLRSGAHRLASADDSFDAGRALAEQLNGPDLKGVLLLSKGLDVNGSDLVRGFNAALPENVIVTGGLAGDGDRFERTWVLSDGKPVSDHISAVAFYGSQVHIGHGSKGGWDIFGPERKVTRSENNVLYELDDKPALDLYKEYLGDLAEGLPASGLRFPLALRADRNDEKQLVRTILAVDEETKSMTFAGDIPEGYLAQLMRANFDHLIDGAEDAALMTRNRGGDGSTTLAIAISCVGRRIVLGERTEEEVEATMDILPKNTYQVGFYSYGELSPYASGSCDLHNQTMTLTTLHET
jgi:hypothetical protein